MWIVLSGYRNLARCNLKNEPIEKLYAWWISYPHKLLRCIDWGQVDV